VRALLWLRGRCCDCCVGISPRSGLLVDAVIIAGQSKYASFGGDHPQELLAKPFERCATSLF
jgi:hypothetical protein